MMIYRSVVVGLLGAIALLVAEQGGTLDRLAERAGPPAAVVRGRATADDAGPVIVHVSRRGAGADPLPALGLGPAERALTLDDRDLGDDWREVLRRRWAETEAGRYFELWLGGRDRMRRMVVLVTP